VDDYDIHGHPTVADVDVAETIPERLAHAKKAFKLATTCTNMEELLKSDVDALALFSQVGF
jgi:predicted dehydrogenase